MSSSDKKKSSANDRLAVFIGFGIVRVQRKIAARLSHWERRLSALQKKLLLGLFCLVTAVYLVYILVRTISGPHSSEVDMPAPTQVVPRLSLPPPEARDTAQTIIFFKSK